MSDTPHTGGVGQVAVGTGGYEGTAGADVAPGSVASRLVVQDLAAMRQHQVDAHQAVIKRHRQLITFMRAHPHLPPGSDELSYAAREAGLFKAGRGFGDIGLFMLRTWQKRGYWESEASAWRTLSGKRVCPGRA